jgi:hypothetical protein
MGSMGGSVWLTVLAIVVLQLPECLGISNDDHTSLDSRRE